MEPKVSLAAYSYNLNSQRDRLVFLFSNDCCAVMK